jgi:hypothetical protein
LCGKYSQGVINFMVRTFLKGIYGARLLFFGSFSSKAQLSLP